MGTIRTLEDAKLGRLLHDRVTTLGGDVNPWFAAQLPTVEDPS
jgi:hypothetical protein